MNIYDYLFVSVWAFVGSSIGYFSFTDNPSSNKLARFMKYILIVSVGMFIALPISTYLVEANIFSKTLSLMLGGMGAFGLPDFILKSLPTLVNKLIHKKLDIEE